MVDARRLRSMLDRLGAELVHLDRLAAMTDAELVADPDRMAGLKYRLQVAIETAIDAAEHTIAADGLRAPESFADTFLVLGEAGVIEAELADSLADAARLRNLLVHQYADIDDARVREVVRTRLGDLAHLRAALAALAVER